MKKLLAVFGSVALLSPVLAFADIDIDSGYPTPQNSSVEVGQMITFTVRADTNGSGNDNDWKSTEWDVITDGVSAVCDNHPQITQSTNNVSATWDYIAVQAGQKTVQVKVYNSPNCQGSARDTATTGLTVTEPVVEEPTDTDGDGVIDEEDACPEVFGEQEDGCPIPEPTDTDGDGIVDEEDSCPEVAGNLPNGCPEEPSPEPESTPSEPEQTSTGGGGGPCHPSTGFPECQQNVAHFIWWNQVLAWQDILQQLQILVWKLEEANK